MSGEKTAKIKSNFKKNALIHRYHSSRWTFIFATLVFFLNYLFVGANFYYDAFILTLPFTYVTFIISILFFVFFTIKKMYTGKISEMLFYGIFVVLAIILSSALLPFIIKQG